MNEVWLVIANCFMIAFFIGLVFWLLNFLFPKKHYDIVLGFILILLSIGTVLYSMYYIRGWEGMGVGLMAALALGGTIIALMISTIIKMLLRNRGKTKTD